jgi:hypothetical protein
MHSAAAADSSPAVKFAVRVPLPITCVLTRATDGAASAATKTSTFGPTQA